MIFPISDCEAEHKLTPNSTLEVLNSIDGHLALQGLDNSMMTQLHRALFELLSAAA
jgi:homoserine O-acetyltransferase/O-succinyltransferase